MRWPWEWLHRGRLEELEERAADTDEANQRLDRKLQEKNRILANIDQQLHANHFIDRIDALFREDKDR